MTESNAYRPAESYIYEYLDDKFPPHIRQYIPKGVYLIDRRGPILDRFADRVWGVWPNGFVGLVLNRTQDWLPVEYSTWLRLQMKPWAGMQEYPHVLR